MIIGCASLLCSSPGRAGLSAPAATATTTTTLPEVVCGDANGDGAVRAGDALLALRAAVGSSTCSLEVCDYTGDGKVAASDALAILRKAVGQEVAAHCPPAPTTPLTWDEGAWGQVSWN